MNVTTKLENVFVWRALKVNTVTNVNLVIIASRIAVDVIAMNQAPNQALVEVMVFASVMKQASVLAARMYKADVVIFVKRAHLPFQPTIRLVVLPVSVLENLLAVNSLLWYGSRKAFHNVKCFW